MSWIIKVDHLSKIYRTGSGASQHGTLYEQISRKIKAYLPGQKESIAEDLNENSTKLVVSKDQTEDLPPGYFWALKDISFEVNAGERIGLIGQNGSGKSTLLKILSRITAQTHGEFRYRGHLISLLEVGTGFHPELSGRENIYLNAAINGMSRQQIKRRFKSIVDFSELGSQIDTPVKRYSSGMYMRLAFSVAAFLESEILLIDEVLAVGDNAFQKKCKEKMLELANDGRSVIFVSHDMSAIEAICKKTIEMSHGKIIAIRDIVKTEGKQEEQASIILNPKTTPQLTNHLESHSPLILNTEQVSLLSFQLFDNKDKIQNQFTVDEPIHIKVSFRVSVPNLRLVLRIDLRSSAGILICSLMDHHLLQTQQGLRKPGLYNEVVFIPKDYLNEGNFLVSIHLIDLEHNEHAISCESCLNFDVIDNKLPVGVRANWVGDWPEALLRPQLTWKVDYISEQEDILDPKEVLLEV